MNNKPNSDVILTVLKRHGMTDAAQVVHAYNVHDELLAALRRISADADALSWEEVRLIADAAIAKAVQS